MFTNAHLVHLGNLCGHRILKPVERTGDKSKCLSEHLNHFFAKNLEKLRVNRPAFQKMCRTAFIKKNLFVCLKMLICQRTFRLRSHKFPLNVCILVNQKEDWASSFFKILQLITSRFPSKSPKFFRVIPWFPWFYFGVVE